MTKEEILNKNISKKAQSKLGITYNQKIKKVALESMQEYAEQYLKDTLKNGEKKFKSDMTKSFVAGVGMGRGQGLRTYCENKEDDIEHGGFSSWFAFNYG